jgi:hypothetical protein
MAFGHGELHAFPSRRRTRAESTHSPFEDLTSTPTALKGDPGSEDWGHWCLVYVGQERQVTFHRGSKSAAPNEAVMVTTRRRVFVCRSGYRGSSQQGCPILAILYGSFSFLDIRHGVLEVRAGLLMLRALHTEGTSRNVGFVASHVYSYSPPEPDDRRDLANMELDRVKGQ